MKELYCWRCKQTVPMLDEAEHATIQKAFLRSQEAEDDAGDGDGDDDEAATVIETGENHFAAVIDVFEQLTGSRDCTIHAITHHRVSLYGAPCPTCGKPFRTPKATECYFCARAV